MARWRRPRSSGRVTPAKVKRSKTYRRGMAMYVIGTLAFVTILPRWGYAQLYEFTSQFRKGS